MLYETRFTFARPIRQAHRDSTMSAATRIPETLLLVEDDDDIREGLTELLEDNGYVVATARNGEDALQQLSGGLRPSGILLDVAMPVMDGLEFRRAQLAQPQLKDIPVVIITASEVNAEALEAQLAVAVLPKPVSLPALFAVLDRLRPGGSHRR